MVKAPVAPTQAIVKVRTSGTLPSGTAISAIKTTVNYPATRGLSISENNVVASGTGTGSLFVANVSTTPGQVLLALISLNGIQAGEFASLTFSIAPGNTHRWPVTLPSPPAPALLTSIARRYRV